MLIFNAHFFLLLQFYACCKDDIHPRYVEAVGRQSRARYDYDGSNAAFQYGESDYYSNEPARL